MTGIRLEIKVFLAKLKERLGACGRREFLQRLRVRFSAGASAAPRSDSVLPDALRSEQDAVNLAEEADTLSLYDPITIDSYEAWQNHVQKVSDISKMRNCLAEYDSLAQDENMQKYFTSVNKTLEREIPKFVEKIFKKPCDIEENTSEDVAEQTGKFVKACILDLLRGCNSGIKHSSGTINSFYKAFAESVEKYLASIGVYCHHVVTGDNFKSLTRWFEPPSIITTADEKQVGVIDEIQLAPHRIPFLDQNEDRDELVLRGICTVFGHR
ncbi:MAG: hypothetical protein Q4F00_07885 [bacterium]|nr:hypothetical protein [bacterium]